ncbi:UNVERIFIED_CONTAM: hypothetical protein GTU68_047355 [Idotea baltica]|nr:hypothetical protein [Idotea baltica]
MKAKYDIKQLRTIGHKLKPVVTIAGKGLSENVITEIERALNDHELIKIKLSVGDKATRTEVAEALCTQVKAELIHSIGGIIVIMRRCKQPDPRLSNLIRRV